VRRRLALGAAAVTVAVVVSFLVPLGVAVDVIATERASNSGQLESQPLAAILTTVEDQLTVARVVAEVSARSADLITVFLPNGDIVGDDSEGGAALQLARRGRAFTTSVREGRAIFVPVRGPSGTTAVIRVTVPTTELHRGVAKTRLAMAGIGVVLVALAVALADRLALSLTRPVTRLVDTADRLQRGELTARVTPSGPAEIATVGHALNLLASRIGDLVKAERESVADVSHRLRTPLTVLKLDVDNLPDGDAHRRLVNDVEELTASLDRAIAEARQMGAPAVTVNCDLVQVTRELVGFWAELARSQSRPCSMVLPADALVVRVPAADLKATIDALIANVFAHTPEGTGFRVEVAVGEDGRGRLVIEDDGPGWPGGFQLERGRSGRGSTGLGLDIARRTAEASGGAFRVGPSESGGARVELEFRAADQSS